MSPFVSADITPKNESKKNQKSFVGTFFFASIN